MGHVFTDPKYQDAERRAWSVDPIVLEMGQWTARAEAVRQLYVWDRMSPDDERLYAYVAWTGRLPQQAEFGHFFTLWGYAAARTRTIDQWLVAAFGRGSSVSLTTQILEVKRPRATVETLDIRGGGVQVNVYTALGVDAIRAIETAEQADAVARTVVQSELSMLAHAFGLDDPADLMPGTLPDVVHSVRERLCWPGDPEIMAGYARQLGYRELLQALNERPSSRWPIDGKPPIRPSTRPLPTR